MEVQSIGDFTEPEHQKGDLLIIDPEQAFHGTLHDRIGVVKYTGTYKIRQIHLTPDGTRYLPEPLNKSYEIEVVPVTGTTIYKIVIPFHPFNDCSLPIDRAAFVCASLFL